MRSRFAATTAAIISHIAVVTKLLQLVRASLLSSQPYSRPLDTFNWTATTMDSEELEKLRKARKRAEANERHIIELSQYMLSRRVVQIECRHVVIAGTCLFCGSYLLDRFGKIERRKVQ